MAQPAKQDDYTLDTDFDSAASTALKDGAHTSAKPTAKRNARRRSSQRAATSTNRIRPTQRNFQTQPQTDDETAHSYREVLEEVRHEGAIHVAPRRLRKGHRAFRMSWTATFAGTILFGQLLAALWLKALAVSASHQTDALIGKIAEAESQIDKTQTKIAVLDGNPRLTPAEIKAGYRQYQQSELDVVPAQTAANIEYSKPAETQQTQGVSPQTDSPENVPSQNGDAR